MFRHLLCLVLFLSLASAVSAQPKRTQFRPAVLGSGADSLVNRIDLKELEKKGQKAGAVMFCAVVTPTGEAGSAWTYRAMPETEALEEELNKKLQDAKFTPPLYNYQPVTVLLFATVLYSPTTKPRLQILLNQDPQAIKDQSDLIAPQPVVGGDSKFDGLTPPPTEVPLTAVVDLALKVNREGTLEDARIIAEEPPLLGYGSAALADLQGAKFIPAFRSGDPDAIEIVQPICYKPEL